jgi:hypothetical protein
MQTDSRSSEDKARVKRLQMQPEKRTKTRMTIRCKRIMRTRRKVPDDMEYSVIMVAPVVKGCSR